MTELTDSAAPDPQSLTLVGQLASGSNQVFVCTDHTNARWVYKPVRGEFPLPDFPDGTLAAREVAAWHVDQALGWQLIPPTYLVDGPFGEGMVQQWIDAADPGEVASGVEMAEAVQLHPAQQVPEGYIPVLSGTDDHGNEIVLSHSSCHRVRQIALLDHVINNADRKGGHLLTAIDGTIWAIDHGLAFHSAPKLRTVLWGWANHDIPPADLEALHRLRAACHADSQLVDTLSELVTPREVAAMVNRVDRLCDNPVFPPPMTGYPLPWPLF